ncbi:TPA: ABC transporter ATP-binding protein [Candidatus Dependentiae bacterium]|nr:ABC transporter ATP-binding protein [Candidatus Dependentiae bacterium]
MRIFKKTRLPVILQAEVTECGHACIAMIIQYYGGNARLSTLRRIFPTSLRGVSLAYLIKILEYFNLSSRVYRIEPLHLKTLLLPAILHWDMNHFIVLKACRKNYYIIHDPAKGERKISQKDLSEHFTGIALEIDEPTCEKPIKKLPESEKKLGLFGLLTGISGFNREIVKIIFLALLLQLVTLIGPKYMQLVIDKVIVSNKLQLLYLLAMSFFCLKVLETLITAIRSIVITNLGILMNLHLGTKVFNHMIRLPIEYFERRHLGDIVSKFGSIEQIRQLVTQGFMEGGVDGLMATMTLIMMLFYSVKLSLIVILTLIIYTIIRFILFAKFKVENETQLNLQAIQNSSFMENVRGIQPIKIFGKEDSTIKKWRNKYLAFLHSSFKVSNLNTLFMACKNFLFGTELILIIFFGALFVIKKDLTIGMLYAFVFYQTMFLTAGDSLIQKLWSYKMLSIYLDRLSDIVNNKTEELNTKEGIFYSGFNKKIQTLNLSFCYSSIEQNVISDLNLTINNREFVVITGPSGCGKTTLLKLLMGLLKPTSGEIIIDNISLNKINIKQYRQTISSVMQEDSLLAGSIAENISFFEQNADISQIKECAQIAGVLEDIESMPMGFYTLVGDMGSTLSGGQKQRILLARALYKKPKILFLDEATSHLDISKENTVNLAIKNLGITRISIAHRKETIEMADRIIYLDKLNKQ